MPHQHFGVRLLSGIFEKKCLNARGFAWEFLRSVCSTDPVEVSKDGAKVMM